MYKTADIYFTEYLVKQDTSLLPYGDFQNEKMAVQEYGDYREQSTHGAKQVSRFSQYYSISYSKVDDLISQIGGFVQSVMVVAAVIVGFYNQEYYTIELANKIYDFDTKNKNDDDSRHDGDLNKLANSKLTKSQRKKLQELMASSSPQKNKFKNLTQILSNKQNDEKYKNDEYNLNLGIGVNQSQHLKNIEIQKSQVKANHIHFQLDDLSLNGEIVKETNQKKEKLYLNINQNSILQDSISNKDAQQILKDISRTNNCQDHTNSNKDDITSNINSFNQFQNQISQIKNNSCLIKQSINNSINSINNKNSSNNLINNAIQNINNKTVSYNNSPNLNNSTKKINENKQSSSIKKINQEMKELYLNINCQSPQSPQSPNKIDNSLQKIDQEDLITNQIQTISKNDILKYTTISPLSLTEIGQKLEKGNDKQIEAKKVLNKKSQSISSINDNKMTSSDEAKVNQISPQLLTQSPNFQQNTLLSLRFQKQDEGSSLQFLDRSNFYPESSEDQSSDQHNQIQQALQIMKIKENNGNKYHEMQPNSNKNRQNELQITKSITQTKDCHIKEERSFKYYKNNKTTEDEPLEQNEAQKKNFLSAYHEEMRKDYMSKQFGKVLSKRSKLKISLKYFIFRLTCGKLFCTKENLLIQKAHVFLQKDVDIIVILNKIKELEKLKCLLLDPNQLTLFNYFPKPLLSVDQKKRVVFKVEQMIKEQKKFQQKCKSLSINPLLFLTVKKAKDKFKNLLINKNKNRELFSNEHLVRTMNGSQNDYQKLYKAYEKINNQQEKTRMDEILIKTLGEETKRVFQESLQQIYKLIYFEYLIYCGIIQNEFWHGQTLKSDDKK